MEDEKKRRFGEFIFAMVGHEAESKPAALKEKGAAPGVSEFLRG